MEKFKHLLGWLDWATGFGTIAYGLYSQTWWIVGIGILGLGIAWFGPAKRLEKKLQSKMMRRGAKIITEGDAEAGEDENALAIVDKPEPKKATEYVSRNFMDMTGYGNNNIKYF